MATLTYTSQTEEICTGDRTSGALTAVDAGVCTVEVTAEVTGYTSMSISSSITITPAAVSFAWTGYSAGSAVFGTVPPTLNGPTGAPAGTGFRYSSTPLTVCLVDGETGALTLSGVGTCTVTAVGSLLGYTDGSETFDLTVTPGMMSSLRWSGYLASSIDFGDTAPSIVRPEGVPQGTSFRYTSSTPDICTVDSGSGVLNILNAGDCMIGLTALATNYGDATVNVTLAVNSLEMDSLTWSGYSSSSIDYDDGAPTHNPPRGLPPGAILNYTTTTDACTVNSLTGVLTIVDAGTCTVSLTVSAIGYSNTTIDRNVMVNGRVINVTWTGYSSSSIVFGESLTLDSPTANPSNVTLSYASDTTDICTVDGVTGAVTMVDNGTCTITLTASAIGYNDATESHSITVNSRAMSGVAWSGYAASSILIKGPFVYPNPVEGAPYRAGYRYSTSTPNVCAVEKDGDLWGRDLGTCRVGVTVRAPGYKDQTFPEVDVTVVRGGIAVGEYQSCALLSDGQVKCWGSNTTGSLGQGHRDNLGDDINEMGTHLMSVDLGTGLKAKYLAVIKGEFYRLGHSCAIVDDGRVKCWGSNHSGQLGQGHNRDIGDNSGEMGDNLAYTNLGDERTKILSLGGSFSCAVLNNNKVKCWGEIYVENWDKIIVILRDKIREIWETIFYIQIWVRKDGPKILVRDLIMFVFFWITTMSNVGEQTIMDNWGKGI